MRIMAKPVRQATPSIVTIITEFNVPTPGALFWLNSSQMPPHVPGRGIVGHYFDRCIIDVVSDTVMFVCSVELIFWRSALTVAIYIIYIVIAYYVHVHCVCCEKERGLGMVSVHCSLNGDRICSHTYCFNQVVTVSLNFPIDFMYTYKFVMHHWHVIII